MCPAQTFQCFFATELLCLTSKLSEGEKLVTKQLPVLAFCMAMAMSTLSTGQEEVNKPSGNIGSNGHPATNLFARDLSRNVSLSPPLGGPDTGLSVGLTDSRPRSSGTVKRVVTKKKKRSPVASAVFFGGGPPPKAHIHGHYDCEAHNDSGMSQACGHKGKVVVLERKPGS